MPSRQLRKSLKLARSSLAPEEREQHSLRIARNLANYLPFRRCKKVAVYMSTNDEVDTWPVMELCESLGKEIFLPVVNQTKWRGDPLLFCRFEPGTTPLRRNRYGIDEPIERAGSSLRARDMPLICVPVVGFNSHCDRIGMGGGYYDRTLAQPGVINNHLVGLAFELQFAEFEPEAHDIPMHAVITEARIALRGVR